MLRYHLDDLGWFSFEKLIQSLLKADLGLAIESWGGHADLGRDAYSTTRLAFPDRSKKSNGPFLFQAKFVQSANAPGAAWESAIRKATGSERARIQQHRRYGKWRDPRHYILLTNCPLSATARATLQDDLKADLPKSHITLLGGSDVCDIIDNHPGLRRSFPEILSLRDLDILLSEAVNKDILERSRAAVEESRDLVPVFVPTGAYHRAWSLLQKYSFVVLDGPPEMGKTAIARTIALAHLFSDWQAIDCRDPGDFFSVFTDQRQQLFVADDAFGRTEYDPTLGRMWERDLPRIFHCLDSRHRLIWTTRKHILIRALREMDLTGKASRFPKPGEVIVTADDLSLEEKARILYRHSRAARPNDKLREVIRHTAIEIVKNEHFTPERIRRFVQNVLPDIGRRGSRKGTAQSINIEIQNAMRNPTDRMKKAFLKLTENHRWVLIAFLECDDAVPPDALRQRFVTYRPAASNRTFEDALDDLLGTFLKIAAGRHSWEGKRVNWIHPSYRDLVIDELSSNSEQQTIFLERITANGIKLALSVAGGIRGERMMPLMTTAKSWVTLANRCRELAENESDEVVAALIDIISSTFRVAEPSAQRGEIVRLLQLVCDTAATRWDRRSRVLGLNVFRAFARAIDVMKEGDVKLPHVDASWSAMSDELQRAMEYRSVSDIVISEWTELGTLIERYYSEFALSSDFRTTRAWIEERLFALADEEVAAGAKLRDPESNRFRGRRLEEFAGMIESIDRDGSRENIVLSLYGLATEYMSSDQYDDESDYEHEPAEHVPREFDVVGLFEDL